MDCCFVYSAEIVLRSVPTDSAAAPRQTNSAVPGWAKWEVRQRDCFSARANTEELTGLFSGAGRTVDYHNAGETSGSPSIHHTPTRASDMKSWNRGATLSFSQLIAATVIGSLAERALWLTAGTFSAGSFAWQPRLNSRRGS